MRDEYDIQAEFGDIGNLLAYVSVGDRAKDIERLVSALAEIRRIIKKDHKGMLEAEYISPKVMCGPQDAFYSEKVSLPLDESCGKVCSDL